MAYVDGYLITPDSDISPQSELFVYGAMTIPIEQQAPCFFMANYVLIPRNEHGRGYFDFLVPMMKTEQPDSALSQSFRAVAMASIANRPSTRGSGLMAQAIGQYAKALKSTNLALQDPSRQKDDQTLASILMLGFFEVSFAFSSPFFQR